jgi:hypothetical protein
MVTGQITEQDVQRVLEGATIKISLEDGSVAVLWVRGGRLYLTVEPKKSTLKSE